MWKGDATLEILSTRQTAKVVDKNFYKQDRTSHILTELLEIGGPETSNQNMSTVSQKPSILSLKVASERRYDALQDSEMTESLRQR